MKMNTKTLRPEPFRPVAMAAMLLGSALSVFAAEPNPLFVRSCAGCHGTDGRAETKMGKFLGVKDLTRSKLSEAGIQQVIRDGISTPEGRRRMPAFAESLSADEVRSLASRVKSLQK